MDSSTLGAAIQAINAALVQRNEPVISGAELGLLIKRAVPDFDVREATGVKTGALKKFVAECLSPYLSWHSAGPGGDPVYAIVSTLPQAMRTAAAEEDLWSAFVRPSLSKVLVLDERTGDLSVSSREAVITGRTIAPVTEAELKSIQADYLSGVADANYRSVLSSAQNYAAWVATLKQHGPDSYRHWSVFRREALERLLDARLGQQGVGEPLRSRVVAQLKESQTTTAQRHAAVQATLERSSITSSTPDGVTAADDQFIRKLIGDAVRRMSIDEIRGLQVPFGAVFDAFRSRK